MDAMEPLVRVQSEDFDVAAETARITAGRRDIGAVVSFTGLCRDEGGALAALELEHYPGMAEAEILRVCQLAADRWPLQGLSAIHRYGKIAPGGNIVLVIAASSHRQAAFDAANFVMDFLKTSAPFWKKEHFADGSEGGWVSAKDADDAARKRWEEVDSPKDSEGGEFEIETGSRVVRLWSQKQMPLSPVGAMLQARDSVRQELAKIEPHAGEILHCVHTCLSLGRNDVENILIYNIGTGAFKNASRNGLSFQFNKSLPPKSVNGRIFPALNAYFLGAPPKIQKNIAAEFTFDTKKMNSIFEIWWELYNAEGKFYHSINDKFGLRIEIGSKKNLANLGNNLKKLVDAIVVGLHTDANPDVTAIASLAQKFGIDRAEIVRRLQVPRFPVLGAARGPLVRPFIKQKEHSVQWHPEDNNCVECVLLPTFSDQSYCRVLVYDV